MDSCFRRNGIIHHPSFQRKLESRGVICMSTIKVRTKRQITIPKAIFNDLGLKEGDYVEIIHNKNQIVIKPKK